MTESIWWHKRGQDPEEEMKENSNLFHALAQNAPLEGAPPEAAEAISALGSAMEEIVKALGEGLR